MLKCLVLISAFLLGSCALYGQVEVGNGGDTVRCRGSQTNNLNGLYVYDYLATYNPQTGNSDITQANDPTRRIYNIFRNKIPVLEASLRDFLDDFNHQILQTPHSQRRNVWRASIMQRFVVDDEHIVNGIPENCRQENDLRTFEFNQTVYRMQMPENKLFLYDLDLMTELSKNPLQYSFMIIHEWLWDYCENAAIIREVNRFLHTADIENFTDIELQQELRSRGMQLQVIVPKVIEPKVTFEENASGLILKIDGVETNLIELDMHQRALVHFENKSSKALILKKHDGFDTSLMPGGTYIGWAPSQLPGYFNVLAFNNLGAVVDTGIAIVFRRLSQ
jgi:hypothetical protein